LQTVEDFISGNGTTTEKFEAIDHGEWVKKNQSIYSQEPLFSIKNVDVEYVTKRNLWGKIREKNQAVASMSFNLYPGETLGWWENRDAEKRRWAGPSLTLSTIARDR